VKKRIADSLAGAQDQAGSRPAAGKARIAQGADQYFGFPGAACCPPSDLFTRKRGWLRTSGLRPAGTLHRARALSA
jgi:hypothetical protein